MNWIWIVLATTSVQYALSEVFSLFDVAARWLIRRSVIGIPEDMRARYAQEWEGELEAIPGSGLMRLLFAVRVRMRVRATARELGVISSRRPFKVQLARVGFMFAATLLTIVFVPATILFAGAIAVFYGRPVLRSRVVRTRDGRAVTLYSFNVPASSAFGRFFDRTGFDALPSLFSMARGQIWPTVAQLRIITGDLMNGRPTQPFRDRGA